MAPSLLTTMEHLQCRMIWPTGGSRWNKTERKSISPNRTFSSKEVAQSHRVWRDIYARPL